MPRSKKRERKRVFCFRDLKLKEKCQNPLLKYTGVEGGLCCSGPSATGLGLSV